MILMMAALAGQPPQVHSTQRPIKLGSRLGGWAGPYEAPLIGGHIKIAASRGIGIEGFADNTLMIRDGVARHDHIIGFSGYFPQLLGTERGFVSPTLGSCVDFRVDTPLERAPGSTDVLFGVHGGGMAELALFGPFSIQTQATAFLYIGNRARDEDWATGSSNTLQTSAVGQFLGSVNVRL